MRVSIAYGIDIDNDLTMTTLDGMLDVELSRGAKIVSSEIGGAVMRFSQIALRSFHKLLRI
jgi:hypothetical protein